MTKTILTSLLMLVAVAAAWTFTAPSADADGNPGTVAWRQGASSITAQLGETGTAWGSVQNRNVCDRTASTPYAADGGWNAVAFRLGKGLPCRTHTPTPYGRPMSAYELKITSTDSTAHGETADLVPGADIEYVNGLTCNDGSWRNAEGKTYNRIYARRLGASPDKGTFGNCNSVGNLPDRVNFRFSVPASHAAAVWVHLTMWIDDNRHTHARLKFDAPEPPAAPEPPEPPPACVGPIQRAVNRYGSDRDSQDSSGRYSLIQVTAVYDCNGEAYTSRTQYGALVNDIPTDIERPQTPDCSEIRRGLSWDYDRNGDDSLATTQGEEGPRYQFRVSWTRDDCTRTSHAGGSVGNDTYCGGGVLSQTPVILQRAIAADNSRIVYEVQLFQSLRGSGSDCPLEISDKFWTYDVPAAITAP